VGIQGPYASIQYPRWALVAFGFAFALVSAGVTMGVWYAVGQARVLALEAHAVQATHRVDTIDARVDSIVVGAVEPARLLRALATLRCLDGTPSNLLSAADLPCEQLVRIGVTPIESTPRRRR
jgi:hypothetical protein